jgi:glycosyltransferase involved in cell wall biosynthesis
MLGGAPPAATWRRTRDRLARRLAHLIVFGAAAAPRQVLRALVGPGLARIGSGFDPAFYLAQVPSGLPRRRAARDPLLHYWLIGARQGRWPSPGFKGGASAPAPSRGGDKVALIIDHGRGGGSSRLLAQHAAKLANEGWKVLASRRVGRETPLFLFPDAEGWRAFDLFADAAPLADFARAQGVNLVIVNHLIDLPQDAADWLARFAGSIGARLEVLLHDYYLACPRIDLIASDGRYCGLAPTDTCRACLVASGPVLSGVDIVAWRRRSGVLLATAARAIAPSQDLAGRLAAAFPDASIEVEEPENDAVLPASSSPPPLALGENLRVLVLGALNRPKGLAVIIALARVLVARGAPVRITLLGPAADGRALRAAGVELLGRYSPETVQERLAAAAPHVIFFPAIWPETWSYTLTEALRSDAEIVAFDIGAIAERLKRLGRGRIIPHAASADPAVLAKIFIDLRRDLEAKPTPACAPRGVA